MQSPSEIRDLLFRTCFISVILWLGSACHRIVTEAEDSSTGPQAASWMFSSLVLSWVVFLQTGMGVMEVTCSVSFRCRKGSTRYVHRKGSNAVCASAFCHMTLCPHTSGHFVHTHQDTAAHIRTLCCTHQDTLPNHKQDTLLHTYVGHVVCTH